MNDLMNIKILIALGTFCISFISAAAPLKVIKVDDHLFSVGNLMAAGVLLSAGLVHQLTDSIHALEDVTDFPLATFIAGLTFCFFLLLEEYLHTHFGNSFEELHQKNYSVASYDSANLRSIDDTSDDDLSFDSKADLDHERSGLIAYTEKESKTKEYVAAENKHQHVVSLSPSLNDNSKSFGGAEFFRACICNNRSDSRMLLPVARSSRPVILDLMLNDSFRYEHPVHYDDEHLAKHAHGSLLSSIILLLALSVHSLFEGLAIGVSSNNSQLISTTAAVLAHKAFAGYALGSTMVASHMKHSHILVLCFSFSFCSIIGVSIGILLEDIIEPDDTVPIGVIQAMVTGTFLYVSIVEIGMKELMTHRESSAAGDNHSSWKIWEVRKLAAFLLGYLMMSFLAIWI